MATLEMQDFNFLDLKGTEENLEAFYRAGMSGKLTGKMQGFYQKQIAAAKYVLPGAGVSYDKVESLPFYSALYNAIQDETRRTNFCFDTEGNFAGFCQGVRSDLSNYKFTKPSQFFFGANSGVLGALNNGAGACSIVQDNGAIIDVYNSIPGENKEIAVAHGGTIVNIADSEIVILGECKIGDKYHNPKGKELLIYGEKNNLVNKIELK